MDHEEFQVVIEEDERIITFDVRHIIVLQNSDINFLPKQIYEISHGEMRASPNGKR